MNLSDSVFQTLKRRLTRFNDDSLFFLMYAKSSLLMLLHVIVGLSGSFIKMKKKLLSSQHRSKVSENDVDEQTTKNADEVMRNHLFSLQSAALPTYPGLFMFNAWHYSADKPLPQSRLMTTACMH